MHEYHVVAGIAVMPGQVTPLRSLFEAVFGTKECARFYSVRSAFTSLEDERGNTAMLRPPHSELEPLQSFCTGSVAELLFLVAGSGVRKSLSRSSQR